MPQSLRSGWRQVLRRLTTAIGGERSSARPCWRPALETLEGRSVPAAVLAAAAGAGGPPLVRVFDAAGGVVAQFMAYDPAFRGGVWVAAGDVTGDGVDDVVTAPGPGGGPHVKVFDGAALLTGVARPVAEWMAYDPAFRGGVNIAVADVTGDGYADVVTGAGPGGGPHVKVFDTATGQAVYSFFAYEDSFRGGVSVAAGFVSGSNGRADVVTAPGPGGGPLVRDFNRVSGRLAREWLAYDAGFRGGMSVAVGELTGDGQADIVTGAGAGGGPHVKVFDGATVSYGLFSDLPVLTVRQFSAYDPAFRGGVRVAAAELTGDAYAEILTAPGPGGGPYVKVFRRADGRRGPPVADRRRSVPRRSGRRRAGARRPG
ncbi:MAG TPA: VCBS repeat-containing protein [Gemmataceae bacterium]|nr:VCBS repeat-containing protein [Gemmataceae bacterium]